MSQWIDFKKLRETLDFAAVLKHYGVELKARGKDQHQAFCPLPHHNGQKRSPSFAVNLHKRAFHCFGCGAHGNAIDFCVLMEGKDLRNTRDVREVALQLRDQFGDTAQSAPTRSPTNDRRPPTERASPRSPASPSQPVVINPPLDFELRNLDPAHPYLFERGFAAETIAHFGLGFCVRGRFAGRIAIPLHNPQGQLIGYAGRLTKDADISDKNPKYLFPGDRERNGVVQEFRKGVFVYNGNAITEAVSDLVVVEGFASTWWLHQNGVPHVVSLMGASCSPEQGKCIVNLVTPRYANAPPTSGGRVWILTDGDEAGERCAASVFEQVAGSRFVRWLKLNAKKQPTDCSPATLQEWFGASR